MRVIAALYGAIVLFYINYLVSQPIYNKYQIDKFLHIAMGFFLALFLSAFVKDYRLIILLVFVVGISWEIFERYTTWEFFINNFPVKFAVWEAVQDIFADVIGAIFFVWWLYPHLN